MDVFWVVRIPRELQSPGISWNSPDLISTLVPSVGTVTGASGSSEHHAHTLSGPSFNRTVSFADAAMFV